jgi:hypothetical protein
MRDRSAQFGYERVTFGSRSLDGTGLIVCDAIDRGEALRVQVVALIHRLFVGCASVTRRAPRLSSGQRLGSCCLTGSP